MSEPLHVAFVWHMHQPYYRSALTGAFEMPWVRMHALKDYADMVQTLSSYPTLHQTFNLVPCLVEQLEAYASGSFTDVYWEHTVKPGVELDESERAFVLERMCERSDHRRASSHPRYLELACKRESCSSPNWRECARAFTTDELRDLQIWFNLAWFDPQTLEAEPLAGLVARGRDFREEDKQALAEVQARILAQTLPAYRDAAARGQVELSTSPYFHPILPLLANTDSARISSPDTLLPATRFAHPEDAREQIRKALEKHVRVFGETPRGMWCSEQAVGEDVLPMLIDAGLDWTISDETVLRRSLSGADSPDLADDGQAHYLPYRLEREDGVINIVFRDHTLSDLIGFGYQSWDSKDAAADLLRRLREIGASRGGGETGASGSDEPRLVTIALDGENAWEYYPRDGRDFLGHLYEGLSADDSLQSVTISEHLAGSPATRHLNWLHTGSWIGGDLRTWSGDNGHNRAWPLLHRARDLAARELATSDLAARAQDQRSQDGRPQPEATLAANAAEEAKPLAGAQEAAEQDAAAVWRHILVAEGSDWFWWFGNHHHTELDYVWDLNFRLHLQAVYHALAHPVPVELFFPILEPVPSIRPAEPTAPIAPTIDGLAEPDEWQAAGFLTPEYSSTMQPSDTTRIEEVRFGWQGSSLCLLVTPRDSSDLAGLEIEIRVAGLRLADDRVAGLRLVGGGLIEVTCSQDAALTGPVQAAWKKVLEVSVPLRGPELQVSGSIGLVVRIGRRGMIEHVFHSVGVTSE